VYFNYNGARYMIELWKGQYGMTTGCEVGFYRDSGKKLLGAEFFESVPDEMMLDMSVTLLRDGAKIIERRARHWWLTGFKLGVFSETAQLSALVRIAFPNAEMAAAFLRSLYALGYDARNAYAQSAAVTVYFGKPRTKQPVTRGGVMELVAQKRAQLLCEEFRKITNGRTNIFEILADVKQSYPDVYESAIRLGRGAESFTKYLRGIPGIE